MVVRKGRGEVGGLDGEGGGLEWGVESGV